MARTQGVPIAEAIGTTEDTATGDETPPGTRRYLWTGALTALVGLSTLLHWLAGSRIAGPWIMPDEAIYAERTLALWHHGSLPLLHGEGAGYGILYPAVAGVALAWGGFADGYASLKLLQALIISLAAVPVFLYGRRLMPRRHALLAAALTVASPLLLYSGLVMTEVLFYPVGALALVVVALAVETGSHRHQIVALALIALAVLTRVQGVVLVPVFAGAVLLDVAFARDRRRLRSFWPLWLVLLCAAAATAAAPGLFGSYAGTLRGSYPLGRALGLTFDHASLVVLSTGVVPAFALVALLLDARDRGSRALAATTLCATVLVVVQVGFFAARYSPHLLERDLAALPPLYFLTFALWLARGAPRRVVTGVATAFGLACLLMLAPWDHLVDATVLPDTFSVATLYRLHGLGPANVVMAASLILLALCIAARRQFVLLLPLAVAGLLVANSVVATNVIEAQVDADQSNLVGSPPDWIDRAADGPVAYVYDGETYWNSVWQEKLWNDRLDRVLTLSPSSVPGPLPQTAVKLPPDGRLPIRERYVVATDRLSFVGKPVAHLAQSGLDVSGLTLWRLTGPPRLSTIAHDVLPNGDMVGPASIDVYDCARGRLELTLLPKETRTLHVLWDELPVVTANLAGLSVWRGSVPVPPSRASTQCRLTIVPQGLLGSTRIQFVR